MLHLYAKQSVNPYSGLAIKTIFLTLNKSQNVSIDAHDTMPTSSYSSLLYYSNGRHEEEEGYLFSERSIVCT